MPTKSKDKAPLTYRDSGVDIAAGNALVNAIGPLAARTARTGSLGGIGGGGGPFWPHPFGLQGPPPAAPPPRRRRPPQPAPPTGRPDRLRDGGHHRDGS